MQALGKLPIAPLINSCWADVQYATPATVKLIFEHWLHFLRSLADHNAWQAASKPQVVKLMFARASNMQAQTIDELFKEPRSFDAIQIYPRQFADEKFDVMLSCGGKCSVIKKGNKLPPASQPSAACRRPMCSRHSGGCHVGCS